MPIMKAYISFTQLFFNDHVLDFFFRKQAKKHLFEVLAFIGADKSLKSFEDFGELIEEKFDEDLDQFEEFCYENSASEIHEYLYEDK